MTTISVAGTTVHCSTAGQGPALVLVHGTSVDSQANFGHVVHRLADQRKVIYPDYAGCGRSTIPEGELTLDLLVEQIAATIQHTAEGKADLLGDSLGAVVAAATAARHPSLVRKLVLVAGWADSHDARHQLVFSTWARLLELDPELGNRFAVALAVNPPFLTALGDDAIRSFLSQPPQPHTRRRIELGLRINIRKAIQNIVSPTLIIRGTHDYLVPEYQTRVLHELIRDSRYVEIASGHAAFVEQPDSLVELARDFLFT